MTNNRHTLRITALQLLCLLVLPGSTVMHGAQAGLWSISGSMATARDWHTATRLTDGRVLVTGGLVPGGSSTNSAEIFDPISGSWFSAGMMARSRSRHTAECRVRENAE